MRNQINADALDLQDKLVGVNRVAKVVKGGRRFGFAALVVVGDGKGHVCYGKGKAKEVPEAVRKATEQAKKNLIRIPLNGTTVQFGAVGSYGAGQVLLKPAPAGTGIIAGGPVRAVMEMAGVQDVVAKNLGSNNPHNMVKAAVQALRQQHSPADIAARRGKSVAEINTRTQSSK